MVSGTSNSRLELVDSLRGFALLGLFLVHCIEAFELYWIAPTGGPVFNWVFGLFAGKSYALFALCFGVSFFIIMDRAKTRREDFRWRFLWRMFLLLALGLLHGILYRGDILQILALLGLTLLLFDRTNSNGLLLLLAGLCFLQLPLLVRAWSAANGADWALQPPLFLTDTTKPILAEGSLADVIRVNVPHGQLLSWSYYAETGRLTQIMGLFLVGLVLGRIGFFSSPGNYRKARRIALLVAAALSLFLWFLGGPLLDRIAGQESPARIHVQWALDCWTNLSILAVQLLLFIELFQAPARRLLKLLAPAGRMTLTLYIGQSLLFVPFFYGFGLGLYGDLTLGQRLAIGIVAFALQILFARYWFGHFHYGPLEWIWRAGTRADFAIPFRRKRALEGA